MSVLGFYLLHRQSILDVSLLGFSLVDRQALLQLLHILLFSGSALALVVPYARETVDILSHN